MRTVYADYNATTPIGVAAREAMVRAMECWGNPSSSHRLGRESKKALEESRASVARLVGVAPEHLFFTSGGSEANTHVLLGSYFNVTPPFRLLTSRVEHSSVRDAAAWITRLGGEVQYVALDAQGGLAWEAFLSQLDTFSPHLVSLMTANNETGILFPIPDIAGVCKEGGVLFHTDAVQALGKVPSAFFNQADFVSISAHKIHGPKGVGAVVHKPGKKLAATHFGGSQETKRRGGTENLVGICGFGAACAEWGAGTVESIKPLRDKFEQMLRERISDIRIQGDGLPRLGNTTNVRFPGVSAEVLLTALDLEGICVSAGSACSSGSLTPSHVLLEMGLSPEEARECLRFSFGKHTTVDEIDTLTASVINHVQRIRNRKGGAS